MLVASGRLAHAGTSRDDDEVGVLQAAHLGVEVAQARRDARQLSVALERLRREVDRDRQRLREFLEAAVIAAGFGELVQAALGVLDLRPRREVDRGVVGDIDHVLADADQVAAQRQIVDGAAVILGVDDGGRFRREPRQILPDGHAADVSVGGQERLQRDRRGDLAIRIRLPAVS